MNPIHCEMKPPAAGNLEFMIEPLASYICATDRPRAALATTLAALCREVEQTISAANGQIAIFLEKRAS
jgi:hypothetical protein